MQQLRRYRMGRLAQGDGRQAGSNGRGDRCTRAQRQNQGQRAGPVAPRQFLRALVETGEFARHVQRSDMDDQRIEIGPALVAVDPRHGLGAVGPRGEAIDRLGGQHDEFARAQPLRRARHALPIGSQ